MKDHPIRWANGGEFKVANLKTEEGMRKNIEDLFNRWETFVFAIQKEGGTHIMEGCLYQNIIRYFFIGGYPNHLVLEFYDQLMQLLTPVNPHILFLYSRNAHRGTVRCDPIKPYSMGTVRCYIFKKSTNKIVGVYF